MLNVRVRKKSSSVVRWAHNLVSSIRNLENLESDLTYRMVIIGKAIENLQKGQLQLQKPLDSKLNISEKNFCQVFTINLML